MKNFLVFLFLFIPNLGFSQLPPQPDPEPTFLDGSGYGDQLFCKIKFSISSKSTFDYKDGVIGWCDNFRDFRKDCRFEEKDGKWNGFFFHNHFFDAHNYYNAMNLYYTYLRRNSFFANRFSHQWRMTDCVF